MKKIEKNILINISRKLQLKYGIISFILKRYTFTIYKLGYNDGFNYKSSHGCTTAVHNKNERYKRENKKYLKCKGE